MMELSNQMFKDWQLLVHNAYGVEMSNLQESQEFSLLLLLQLKRADVLKLWVVKR